MVRAWSIGSRAVRGEVASRPPTRRPDPPRPPRGASKASTAGAPGRKAGPRVRACHPGRKAREIEERGAVCEGVRLPGAPRPSRSRRVRTQGLASHLRRLAGRKQGQCAPAQLGLAPPQGALFSCPAAAADRRFCLSLLLSPLQKNSPCRASTAARTVSTVASTGRSSVRVRSVGWVWESGCVKGGGGESWGQWKPRAPRARPPAAPHARPSGAAERRAAGPSR